MAKTKLPLLPLPHPLILLPTARITIPVSKSTGEALLTLVQESETQLTIAAVPVSTPDAPLHTWGTAARITRLIKPPVRNLKQPYLLSLLGITRVHVVEKQGDGREEGLSLCLVEYPSQDSTPTTENVVKFKAAALKLLDHLAKDTTQQSKRDTYHKVASMLEEVSEQRAPWMADVMVASINGDYSDKLSFLSATDVNDRLLQATALFIKQTTISEVSQKIAQSVDESLSKQQKEFFLRQQLAAIQRELASLRRSTSASSPNNNSNNSNSNSHEGEGEGQQTSELDNEEQAEVEELADIKVKIEAMAKGSEERKVAVREWRRMKRIPPGSVEHGVVRNYLEWLTAVPWPTSAANLSTSMNVIRSPDFLPNARKQLDADHYGLEKIKKRLVEYLAVVRLKARQAEDEQRKLQATSPIPNPDSKQISSPPQKSSPSVLPLSSQIQKSVKGPILLFVGPPGTGKTSLGQSIARALDRPFQRISLGGVRDEAEIRGHRRTYVGSGPGLVVQALRKAGRPDPVVLLDEIDKVSHSNFHGDPAAALLEVLDPEQNHSFNDHYINVPIDLSPVLFICTANTLETISAPLLDRCEVIHLSGYTYDEKMHIARRFLLPKQLKANGLTSDHLTITEPALLRIATHYTREAGVRSLDRAIGAVVRHKAVEWAEHMDANLTSPDAPSSSSSSSGGVIVESPLPKDAPQYNQVVEEHELEKILGIARWDAEEQEQGREERRGLVYGLVVSGAGEGGVLPVETAAVPGSGKLKLTGSLGEVIRESGELALSWVKGHAYELGVTRKRREDPFRVPEVVDVHLHLPAGAVRKDGPSAGIAMACAFVSLLTGATVPSNVAMTGEITLRGRVGAVGGIKEKVLGAHRAHIAKVILPWANRRDVEHDVPLEVRAEMQFVFVRTMEEALEAAFGKGVLGWRGDVVVMESRL